MAYLHAMALVRFDKVHLHYPSSGHSRMQCDRDFERIKKKRRKRQSFQTFGMGAIDQGN